MLLPSHVIAALTAPVLLASPPAALRSLGVVVEDAGPGLHLLEIRALSARQVLDAHYVIELWGGGELFVTPQPTGRGPWMLSIVDDSRLAAEAGAHLLIHLGLFLEQAPHHLRHDHPQPHGTTPRPVSES